MCIFASHLRLSLIVVFIVWCWIFVHILILSLLRKKLNQEQKDCHLVSKILLFVICVLWPPANVKSKLSCSRAQYSEPNQCSNLEHILNTLFNDKTIVSTQGLAQMLAIPHQPQLLETTMSRQTSCQQRNQPVMEGSGKEDSLSLHCHLSESESYHWFILAPVIKQSKLSILCFAGKIARVNRH